MLLFGLTTLLLVQSSARALEGEGIIGGENVDSNDLTYQVSIQTMGLHGCGGAIIDESHVITAAHCVIEDDESNKFISSHLTVVAGTIDINDLEGHQYEVEKAYVPKEFNMSDAAPIYDIAILKLRTKLDLTDPSLSTISLPSSSLGRNASRVSYAGEEALISGFGWDHVEIKKIPIPKNERTKDGDDFYKIEDGDSDGYLLKAKALVVSNRDCQKYYPHLIYKTLLCAKVNQHDENVKQGVCSGDSGGPLVHDGKTIIGVVSYSPMGCDDSVRPAVYTRVSYFIDFINKARNNVVTNTMRSHTWRTFGIL